MSERRRPLVEILYFDGCPNHEPAVALVERIDRELGTDADLRLVHVGDQEAATRLRFPGSPTIRVDGVDVDPLTAQRGDYALSCRIFTTDDGPAGQPEERWIRDALAKAAIAERSVSSVLEAAAIPPSRCGQKRTARLSDRKRALYRWVIERFALAMPPTAAQFAEQAQELGLEASAALAAFAREDLVHADDAGTITVAYPFSGRPRGHEVAFAGRVVQAMCAIDALGIAAMLGQSIVVRSHDPISGGAIRVHATPDAVISWEPETAVVLAGSSSCDGPSYCGCCDVLNFFESTETAQRYLRDNASVDGMPISIPEAAAAGRTIFGASLEEA
ncbi:MAG: alkylmercury lyase family protein [Gaiellaceae bacterium]